MEFLEQICDLKKKTNPQYHNYLISISKLIDQQKNNYEEPFSNEFTHFYKATPNSFHKFIQANNNKKDQNLNSNNNNNKIQILETERKAQHMQSILNLYQGNTHSNRKWRNKKNLSDIIL